MLINENYNFLYNHRNQFTVGTVKYGHGWRLFDVYNTLEEAEEAVLQAIENDSIDAFSIYHKLKNIIKTAQPGV